MVGVTSPSYRRSAADGVRFVGGYAAGFLAGGIIVAMVALGIGSALQQILPARPREILLGLAFVMLGVLDLLNRTPHLMRQVPQSYARNLAPGWRGVVWGFDLSLLLTTQKTTSLVWATLAAIVLLEPAIALAVVAVMVVVSVAQLVIGVTFDHVPDRAFLTSERTFVRWARAATGLGLLCLGLLLMSW